MPVETIVTAIVAALSAGMADTGKKVVGDAYDGLKSLIKKRFGAESKAAVAITELEASPESVSRSGVLKEELEKVGAGADAEMTSAAQALLAVIRELPQGETTIQNAYGQGNVLVSGPGASAKVKNYFGGSKPNG